MKRFVFSLLMVGMIGITAWAQLSITFVSADQYRTVSGYRLHITTGWGETFFPPSNYERTQLLLSSMTMGFHEPYDPIATLERRIPERDPEFSLLGKLQTNVTWYGRICVWANGGIYAQTDEFTFVLSEPTYYIDECKWAASAFGWTTCLVFFNTSMEDTTVYVSLYSENGYLQDILEYPVDGRQLQTFILNNDYPGFVGYLVIESATPVSWTVWLTNPEWGEMQFDGVLKIPFE